MHRSERLHTIGRIFNWIAYIWSTRVGGESASLMTRRRTEQVFSAVPWAERGDADSDEEPGVIAVQAAFFHQVARDVARLPALIEFIADLMPGDDRSLPGGEGDALGGDRAHEIAAVGRVGMRGRGCYSHDAEYRDRQDKAGQ